MSVFRTRLAPLLSGWLLCGRLLGAQTAPAAAVAPSVPERCRPLASADVAIPESITVSEAIDCAYAWSDASDHQTATRVFARAVAAARRRDDQRGLARALNGSGNEQAEFGGGDGAEALFSESASVAESAGDVNGMARAASSLGSLRVSQARYEEARVLHLRSLELWRSIGLESGVAAALNNVGGAYRALGNFATALEYFQESLARLEAQGDRRRSATVLDNMGIVARRLGDYAQGLALAERALAIRESYQDRPGIAKSLDSLSEAYSAQGNWSAALAALGKSLDIRRELGVNHAVAEGLNNIAVVYQAQGSYEQAIRFLNQALALNRARVGSESLTAEIQTHLGEVFLLEGQLTRSAQVLRESVAASEGAGYREQAANAHVALGRTLAARVELTAARAQFDRCLALRDELGDRGGRAVVLVELAELDRRQGRLRAGRSKAEEAVNLAASMEMPDVQWRGLTLLGQLQRAMGETGHARASFDAAIGLVEDIRGRNPGADDTRSRFFADRLAPFRERMAMAVSEGRAAEALALAERSKARALLDVLRDSAGRAAAMTASERSAEVGLRSALNSASSELQAAVRSPTPNASLVARLRQARDTRRLEYEALQSRLYADHPRLELSRAGLPRLDRLEAQRLVPDGAGAIVEFVLGPSRTFALVVTTGGVRVVTLPLGEAALAILVRRFRSELDRRDLRVDETAAALHASVLAPVRAALGTITNLVVIPDGVLWELPFQALRSDAGRYVIEDMAISYAPSLMVLREMMRLHAPGRGQRTLLAVGNPSVAGTPSLPDAETEVRGIARYYGASSSLVLTGGAAREDRWKREAPSYGVVHLAAHGLLDDASPMYSSLQMVRSPGAGGDDGQLEAWEIMGVALRAELVVFSACETARGRIAPGEGVVGLMWSAFVAGSQASLVSQWRVDSRSSATLMLAFHRNWNAGTQPVSKARALQLASLETLHTPGLSHPFHWAGFILAGDAR